MPSHLVGVVGDDDVRVRQLGGQLDLAAEAAHQIRPVEELRVDDLDGDLAVEVLMPGLVDLAHTAATEPFLQLVGTQNKVVAVTAEQLD